MGINKSGSVQGKVYVSNSTTIKTDGTKDNKTNVGLKAEVPIYSDGQRKVSIGLQVELTHKQ